MEPQRGKVDVGTHNGKKLVAIYRHDDGTVDFETEDGMVYKNCVMKSYTAPKTAEGSIVITESATFEMTPEHQDAFSKVLQNKTLDSVD